MLIKDFSHHGSIGWAIEHLNHGHSLKRAAWGRGMHISLQMPDAHSKMSMPYIYLVTDFGGKLVPWSCNQSDMLAQDWQVLDAVQPGEYHLPKTE